MPNVGKFSNVYDFINKWGEDFVSALDKSLDRKKDTTGALRESIRFQIKIFSEYYQFELNMEDYYKWVDEGRKPGKGPPINPNVILKWVSLKGLSGVVNKKGLKVLSTNINAAKSAAFLINRKIKRFGIKPTYFFSDVFEDGRIEVLKRELGKALKKDVLVEIRQT